MADFPTVAVLAGIPTVGITYFIFQQGNWKLGIMSALFSCVVLFGLGYILDSGHASQGIFEAMLILSLIGTSIYLLFLMIFVIKDFFSAMNKRVN